MRAARRFANADSREQLTASRARLVTEADQARRRVVRDLHDGAQQRLVHAIVTLKLARRAVNPSSRPRRSGAPRGFSALGHVREWAFSDVSGPAGVLGGRGGRLLAPPGTR